MSISLIKSIAWLKGHWKLLATIGIVAIVAVAVIQTYRASRLERQHYELKGKLGEQMADQDKLYAEAAAAQTKRVKERAKERLERKRLEEAIAKAQREGERAKRALAREKEKTAKLEPTELVAQIVERIGFESDLTKSGLYLFTRKGAERTLDRFKDGEFYLSEYSKYQQVLKEHELEVDSFNTSIAECEELGAKNLKGWEDCRETLATAKRDIATLEKIKKSGVWKGRKQGALVVIIIGAGLKLAGVW